MKDGTYGLFKFGIGVRLLGITILVNSIIRYLYIDALYSVCGFFFSVTVCDYQILFNT